MKKQLILLCALAFSASLHVTAQSFRKQISEHPELSANNYLAYPAPSGRLTPAPSGYLPVYLSHYGRHGSRYLIHEQQYLRPIETLQQADSAGVLTNEGKDVLRKLRLMYTESYKRWGELTPLGAQQHQQIARRMYRRFPSVFRDSVWVDARSTDVIRCILSMENELQELIRHNPRLRIRHDASAHDMYFMKQPDKKLSHQRDSSAVKNTIDEWGKRNIDTKPLMARLFKDKEYVTKKVDAGQLTFDLFSLASIVQNSEIRHSLSLYNLFTADELYQLWQRSNAWWYLRYASAPQSGGNQPFSQRNLLRKIITDADSCLALPHPGATLRFGHDTMVMPLTCLLNLNNNDIRVSDIDSLTLKGWSSTRIVPMAANIQFVFYKNPKNPKADVLVKVLLNEEEATLPLPKTSTPYYYRWSDFKKFYLSKLNSYHE